MIDDGYTTKTEHYFKAGGELWKVREFNDESIVLEETTKNGQEDCHVCVEVEKTDGVWMVSEWSRERILDSFWDNTADEIEAFLTKHGTPNEND
jgi:hypothetical protein